MAPSTRGARALIAILAGRERTKAIVSILSYRGVRLNVFDEFPVPSLTLRVDDCTPRGGDPDRWELRACPRLVSDRGAGGDGTADENIWLDLKNVHRAGPQGALGPGVCQ